MCGDRKGCQRGGEKMTAPFVGKTLPDMSFEAYQDEKIKDIKLSDYRGKWLILFFYPKRFHICVSDRT